MRGIILSITTLSFLILIFSCSNQPATVLNQKDYNSFLNHNSSIELSTTALDLKFWTNKYLANTNQYPYLVKMAAANETLFSLTGDIQYLAAAGNQLEKANELTNSQNPGIIRSLSKNYISQHRFTSAKELLLQAEIIGQSLEATQKMLFDVHLEIGNNDQAKKYLGYIKDQNAFDYLIRRSKWEDHNGNLDQAIVFMEQALEKAKSHKNKNLIQWSHSNLADFYGHAGRINDAYQNYLAALRIAPYDAYAKKGLAWIAFSHERNPDESKRILKKINNSFNAPDYFLLKSEIAAFEGKEAVRKEYILKYLTAVKDDRYGKMYNKHNISIFAEELNNSTDAIKLAQSEINMRPIPQSYSLLAWTYHLAGNKEKALKIINENVVNKSSEPAILYQVAEIFKVNQLDDEMLNLKKELLSCQYELGPVYAKKIKAL